MNKGINPITFKTYKVADGDVQVPEIVHFTVQRCWFGFQPTTVPDGTHRTGQGVSTENIRKIIIATFWQQETKAIWCIDLPEDRLVLHLKDAFPNGELTGDWPPKDPHAISRIRIPDPVLVTGHRPKNATDEPLAIVHLKLTRMFAQGAGTVVLEAKQEGHSFAVTVDEPYFVQGLKFLFPNGELTDNPTDPRIILAHAQQLKVNT